MTTTKQVIERHACVGTTEEERHRAFFKDHPAEDGWRGALAGPRAGGWHATFEREIERTT